MASRPSAAAEPHGLRGHRTLNPDRMQSRRQEIVQAFAEILAANNYEATTLEDVAARLNCSKAVIYYQFRSKEELFLEMSSTAMNRARERLEAIIAANPSTQDQLREAVTDLVRIGFIPIHTATLRAGAPASLSDEARAQLQALGRRYRETLLGVVRRGMEEGHLARRDAHLVTNTIINASQSVFRWIRADGEIPPEVFIREVPEMVLGGVFANSPGA